MRSILPYNRTKNCGLKEIKRERLEALQLFLIERAHMFSISIVYLIEHLSYSIGFWRGLFTSLKGKFDENHYNCFT